MGSAHGAAKTEAENMMKKAEYLKAASAAVIKFIKGKGSASHAEVSAELEALGLECRSCDAIQVLYAMSIHGDDLKMSGQRGSERWTLAK